MKQIILIIIFCIIPFTAFALDQLADTELDQVTGRFGSEAASDAQPLATPVSDASSNVSNFTPALEPTALGYFGVMSVSNSAESSDNVNTLTKYFSDQREVVTAVGLGFF